MVKIETFVCWRGSETKRIMKTEKQIRQRISRLEKARDEWEKKFGRYDEGLGEFTSEIEGLEWVVQE